MLEVTPQSEPITAAAQDAYAAWRQALATMIAYDTLVGQRIAELREQPIAGTQTIGEFMQRRLSPAMATVAATAQRLASLAVSALEGALIQARVARDPAPIRDACAQVAALIDVS